MHERCPGTGTLCYSARGGVEKSRLIKLHTTHLLFIHLFHNHNNTSDPTQFNITIYQIDSFIIHPRAGPGPQVQYECTIHSHAPATPCAASCQMLSTMVFNPNQDWRRAGARGRCPAGRGLWSGTGAWAGILNFDLVFEGGATALLHFLSSLARRPQGCATRTKYGSSRAKVPMKGGFTSQRKRTLSYFKWNPASCAQSKHTLLLDKHDASVCF